MRTLIFLIVPIYLCFSCIDDNSTSTSSTEKTAEEDSNTQSQDEAVNQKKSTGPKSLNQKDGDGYMQGYWIIYGVDFPERGYPADGKIEEGNFKDSEHHGEWMLYEKDGMTLAAKLNYEQDMLHDTCRYYNHEKNTETVIVYDFGQLVSIETLELEKETQ